MKKNGLLVIVAILLCGSVLQAQTKRSDYFRAKYELKEEVVVNRHNILPDLDARMAETMAKYDAIEDDETTSVNPAPHASALTPAHSYTLSGVPATDSTMGITISAGRKTRKLI